MSSSGIDNLKIIIQKDEQSKNNTSNINLTIINSDKNILSETNNNKSKKYLLDKTTRNIQNFFISYY